MKTQILYLNNKLISISVVLNRFRNRFLSSCLKINPYVNQQVLVNKLHRRFLSSSSKNNPFYTPIPHDLLHNKNKVLSIYFRVHEMYDFLLFSTRIKSMID